MAAKADQPVSVELDLADMLAVGHSIRALARQSGTPEGTKTIYLRVGGSMVAAAHEAIRKGANP